MDIGEGRRGNRKECLHGMTQGIGSSGSHKLNRQSLEGIRVCQAYIRSNTATHDANLAKVLGITDYCKLGDIGTGTTGRRTENERRKRTIDPVRTLKVADLSSI